MGSPPLLELPSPSPLDSAEVVVDAEPVSSPAVLSAPVAESSTAGPVDEAASPSLDDVAMLSVVPDVPPPPCTGAHWPDSAPLPSP